jgi:hypothetical protein
MLVHIPASETEIKAADEGEFVVDDDEFFVVCLLGFD